MSELKRCPFCNGKLKKIGSKCRGNQFYMHEYNGCILQIICFRTDDVESIEKWNTRRSMDRIVERLEEQKALEGDWDDEMSCGAYIAYNYAITVVKEEGGMNERKQTEN